MHLSALLRRLQASCAVLAACFSSPMASPIRRSRLQLDVTDRYIARWKQRVLSSRLFALDDAPQSGRPVYRLTPAMRARILHLRLNVDPPKLVTR
jgi:hypothetical protein